MRAQRLVCTDLGRIELEDFSLAPVPANGILVRNDFTAVSVGTEIYGYVHGGEPGQAPSFPRPTGYCNAGVVLQVGEEVEGIVPGDRVAGQGNHASHGILTGNYRKVPQEVPSKAAAFMVMGAIALHGHRVGGPQLGEAVAVTGMGIVGQLAASFARLAGALPLIAVDLDRLRLDKARQRGADLCVNPDEVEDLPGLVRQHCVADGVDLLVEATGIPAVYPLALRLPRLGGRFLALGSPRGQVEISFLREVHEREVTLLGAHQPKTPDGDHIYYPWSKGRDRDLVLQLMAAGRLPVEDLVTHTARPGDCQQIYQMLALRPREALGVVFEWE